MNQTAELSPDAPPIVTERAARRVAAILSKEAPGAMLRVADRGLREGMLRRMQQELAS